MTKKRILGVDYGDVRTGIAVSDTLGFMASGVATIKEEDANALAKKISEYAKTYEVEKIVIGYPLNMNGTKGPRAEKAEELSNIFKDTYGFDVVLFDERCTTMSAHKILNVTNTRGKKRKQVVDTLSAEIILQNYLDLLKNNI